MKIVLAGGSGFLGRALLARLQSAGHAVANLSRRPRTTHQEDLPWNPDGSAGSWARALDGVDAVINLAGAGVADQRWSDARKREIRSSRVLATRSLVAAMRQLASPPKAFVSGSAVGYYGDRGGDVVTESTPPGSDFLASVCVEWEREAEQAAALTRVALVRTGIVLHPEGGALAQMLLPFKMGVGGPLGSGRQYMPWIHRDDWVDMVIWLASTAAAAGPFNATAPNPVTSAEFARAMGAALSRPAFMPVPGFGLKLLFGEIAGSMLEGQRAIPARALELGFTFRYPELLPALNALLR